AISTIISAFNSLTLSPALSALLLKSREQKAADHERKNKFFVTRWMNKFFDGFNRRFNRASDNYGVTVGGLLKRRTAAMFVYVVLLVMTWGGFQAIPKDFVPIQDKQYLIAFAQLPAGSTLDRAEDVIRDMSTMALEH